MMKKDAERLVEGSSPVAVAELPAMLTIQDLADLLRCSPRTVYRLADIGRIPPPCRLGTLVRWSRGAVQAWFDAGCPTERKTGERKISRN
jgi:excisionase family DNA binding protein